MAGADDEGMRSIRAALRRARHDEAGFSLIELLVAMTLGVLVLGVLVGSYVAQITDARKSVSRADSVREVIPALARMTRDIRSATSVTITGGSQIDLITPEHDGASASTSRHVVYVCGSGKCTRDQGVAPSGVSGTPTTVIERLQSPTTTVFTPASATFTSGAVNATNAPYVAIQLNVALSAPAGRVVQYNDGVTLRNVPAS